MASNLFSKISMKGVISGIVVVLALLYFFQPVITNGLAGFKNLQVGGFFIIIIIGLILWVSYSLISGEFSVDRKQFLLILITLAILIFMLVYVFKIPQFQNVRLAIMSALPLP